MRALAVATVLLAAVHAARAGSSYELILDIPGCCGGGDPLFAVAVAATRDAILAGIPSQTFGAAALFDRRTGTLRHVFTSPEPSAEFGRAVAAYAGDLFVAAPDARFVRGFDARTFAPLVTFTDPNPAERPDSAAFDEFGATLAVGSRVVAVGAPGDDAGGDQAGAVYVFDRRTGALLYRLDSPTPHAGARFGAAVALAGADVVVGASAEGVPAGGGAVYVFSQRSGALRWSRAAPTELGDRLFGFAVAAAGRRIVVGAPCRDTQQTAGTALVYDRVTGEQTGTFSAPMPEACDFFGGAVAMSGNSIAIGARLSGTTDTGAVYVFDAAAGTLQGAFTDGQPEADLGWSVVAQHHQVIVGAAGEDGEVHVYGRR